MPIDRRSFLFGSGALLCVPGSPANAHLRDWREQHGLEQMRQLFRDRPLLSFYRNEGRLLNKVSEEDVIYQSAVEMFSGNGTDEIVLWSNEMPEALENAASDV